MASRVDFPSKGTGETALLTFNFLNVTPTGLDIAGYSFSIAVLSGDDDGDMEDMLVDDSEDQDGPAVSVLCQAGTAGVIYQVTASIELDNGAIYQQVGTLAVLPTDPYAPTPPAVDYIQLWSDDGVIESDGVFIDSSEEFNDVLIGATEVLLLGYWTDEFTYDYPPVTFPLEVDTDGYGAFITLEPSLEMVDESGVFTSDDIPALSDGDQRLALISVDGTEYIAAITNLDTP